MSDPKFIGVFIPMLIISMSSVADYQAGSDALARGDYATAVREFTASATEGDPFSQNLLGHMYYAGDGVEQNYVEAVRWYRMAASQGNADAQYNLAVAYAFGEGITQDYNKAAQWYQRAAKQGHATAQNELQSMERSSLADASRTDAEDQAPAPAASTEVNAPADPPISEQPNTDADEMDDTEKQGGFFSRLFRRGDDEPVQEAGSEQKQVADIEQAQRAPEPVTLPYEDDGYDPENTYPEDQEALQIARMSLDNRDYPLAYEQFSSLALIGDMNAQYELAALYYQGLGTEQDFFEAARWYKRAAEQDHVDAQYSLGNMFLMGEGINQNDQEAALWYGKAADQGHDSAAHNLKNLEKVASASSDEMVVYEGEEDTRTEDGKKKSFLGRLLGRDKTASEENSTNQTVVSVENKEEKGGFFSRIFKRGDKNEEAESAPVSAPEVIEAPVEDVARQTGMDDFIVVEGASEVADPQPGSQEQTGPQEQTPVVAVEQEPEEEKTGFFSRVFKRGDKNEEEAAPTPASTNTAGISEYEQGIAYALGEGVEEDPAEAFNLFMASANQGYAPAQYKVGAAYAYGDGTDQDALEAVSWYRQSARQGYALAQRNLGIMYSSGTGIPEDKPLALAWFGILAEKGNVMDVRRRDALSAGMDQAERNQSEELRQNLIDYINSN